MGDGWSIAWRVLDAQYFGVPQRRRRIALVADFGGSSAPEILFERESLSGDSETCRATREETAGDIAECVGITNRGAHSEVTESLRANSHGAIPNVVYDISQRRDVVREYENTSNTLSKMMGTSGNNVPLVMKIRSGCEGGGKGALIQENKSATLSCNNDQTLFEPCGWDGGQISPTLAKQNAGGNQRMPDKDNFTCVLQPFGICSKGSNVMKSDNPHSGIYEAETARTLDGNGGNPSCNQGGIAVVESYATQYVVRRLTPLECERLQGLPDGWTDIGEWTDSKGRKHRDADSPRYRALGNGIALPPWRFVLSRLATHLPKGATMASLFDGIGSFPLIWEGLGNKTVWQSEIDEFCEAVTKLRFSED